jgi:hypothetical protein
MDDRQSQEQNSGYRGYDAPGEDKVISNTSEAVPSPSVTGRQRMEAPDAFIGGDVNEKPGDDNPALDETTGFAQGKSTTADLLRAREDAEEQITLKRGNEEYADQTTNFDAAAGGPSYYETQDSDPEEAIYEKREFDEPTEPSELDMLGLRGPNVPPDDSDRR